MIGPSSDWMAPEGPADCSSGNGSLVRGEVLAGLNVSRLRDVGRDLAKEMIDGRSVPLLMRVRLGHGFVRGERSTVSGRTVCGQLQRGKRNRDQVVVHPAERPLFAISGIVGLRGNLAHKRAAVKVAGMASLNFAGAARCFGGKACIAVKNKKYRDGDVLVIRRAEPRMRGILARVAARGFHAGH